MITINNLEEMKKYYDKQTNTYVFDDDVEFIIDIKVESDIKAWDIKALDINACNINACDIDAYNINANDIKYCAYCIAYHTFKCKSAKSSRDNSICKCLDSEIEYIKQRRNKMKINREKVYNTV